MLKKLFYLAFPLLLNAANLTYKTGVDWLPSDRGYVKSGIDTFLNCFVKYDGKPCAKQIIHFNDSIFIFPMGFFDKQSTNAAVNYAFLQKPIEAEKSRIRYKINSTGVGFEGIEVYENNKKVALTNTFDMIGTYKEIAPNTGYLHLIRIDKDVAFTINIFYGDSKIIDQEVQKILKKSNTMEMILNTENTSVSQDNSLRVIGFIPKNKK